MTGGGAVAVKQGWDRTTECCKAGCSNDRGVTSTGVPSVHCQFHTDEWELRLSALQAAHPAPPVTFATPAPTRLPADVLEATRCSRCGVAPRDFPDHLCEECRRG